MTPVPITMWEEPEPRGVAASARYAYLTESSSYWGVTVSSSAADGHFVTSASTELGLQTGDSTSSRVVLISGVRVAVLQAPSGSS